MDHPRDAVCAMVCGMQHRLFRDCGFDAQQAVADTACIDDFQIPGG
jgi:hypothetical protein